MTDPLWKDTPLSSVDNGEEVIVVVEVPIIPIMKKFFPPELVRYPPELVRYMPCLVPDDMIMGVSSSTLVNEVDSSILMEEVTLIH